MKSLFFHDGLANVLYASVHASATLDVGTHFDAAAAEFLPAYMEDHRFGLDCCELALQGVFRRSSECQAHRPPPYYLQSEGRDFRVEEAGGAVVKGNIRVRLKHHSCRKVDKRHPLRLDSVSLYCHSNNMLQNAGQKP